MATIADFLAGPPPGGRPPRPEEPHPRRTAADFLADGPAAAFEPASETSTTTTPISTPVPRWARGLATGLRVVPPLATAISGAGLPLTGVSGALGESTAELVERTFGRRPGGRTSFNPLQIGVQGGLSMIPATKLGATAGPLARVGIRAGEGGLLGMGGTGATELAEGRLPSLEQLLMSGLFGGALGGGIGGLEARRAARARAGPPPVAAEPPPPGAMPSPDDVAARAAEDIAGAPFVRLPGAGGEVPPQQPRPADRLARQVERVDELYANLPEPNRQVLREVIADNADELAVAARGRQPIARTEAIARELVFDPRFAKTVASSDVPLEQQVTALGNHVGFFTNRVAELARLAAEHPDKPELKLDVKKAYADLVGTVSALTGRSADAGRALRMLRETRTAFSAGNPRVIKRALEMGVDADRLVDMLAKIDPEDTLSQYRLLQGLRTPGARGYWRWYWYSSLLSRPRTHVRNVVGNNLNLAYKIASTPVAGALERVRGVAPEERTVLAGELGHQVHAWRTALPDAWRKALFMFRNGFSLRDVGETELRPPEVFGGRLLPNVVGRLLGAADEFNRNIAAEVERHGTAYTTAWTRAAREGLEGPARTGRVAELMADLLAEPTPEMLKSMRRFAARSVFQEELPPWMDDFMRMRERMPPGIGAGFDFVMPFVRTPFNILAQGLQASPAGFATGLGRSAGRAGAQARGEAALATMLLAPVAWMAANGNLTGSGPKDPATADALYKSGWRPNSIRIPQADGRDLYIPYGQMQPLALPFATIANLADAAREGQAFDPVVIGAKTAKSVLQQSFLSGVMNTLELLDDPENAAAKWKSQQTQSLIPFSGAVRTVRELEDYGTGEDYLREPASTAEALGVALPTPLRDAAGLPAAPPRLRATGEPARTGRGLGGILAGADIAREPEPTPLDRELERLRTAGLLKPLSLPDRSLSIGGKRQALSRADEYTLRQARGVGVREALEDYMASNAYQRATDERRAVGVRLVVQRTRDMISRRAAAQYRQRGRLQLEELLPASLHP